MMSEQEPRLAETYRLSSNGIEVDGKPFPWHVLANPGPMVQPLDSHSHILWLPVIIDAILPPQLESATTSPQRPPGATHGSQGSRSASDDESGAER